MSEDDERPDEFYTQIRDHEAPEGSVAFSLYVKGHSEGALCKSGPVVLSRELLEDPSFDESSFLIREFLQRVAGAVEVHEDFDASDFWSGLVEDYA